MTPLRDKRTIVLLGLVLQIVLAVVILFREPVLITHSRTGAIAPLLGVIIGAILYGALTRDITFHRLRAGSDGLQQSVLKSLPFVIVGAAEEIIWRGWALQALLPHGVVLALLLTTVGFAAMHGYAQSFAGVRTHLVTGLCFGLVVMITGSLAAAVVAHSIYNGLVVAAASAHSDREQHVFIPTNAASGDAVHASQQ